MKRDPNKVRLSIAVPTDMHEEIMKLAKRETRDFGQEVVHLCAIAINWKKKMRERLSDDVIADMTGDDNLDD